MCLRAIENQKHHFSTLLSSTYWLPIGTINYNCVNLENVEIGVIGIIGESQITSITSTVWENITFVDPTEVVTNYSNELRNEKGCDLVLLLAHSSADALSFTFT